MKLLLKFLINTNLAILLRNTFGLRSINFKLTSSKTPTSVSDAFLWRTDNGYKTKFKYSDILDLFYKKKKTWVEIHIYCRNNQLLKIKKISNLDISNEFEITSEYLGNMKDYGVFYIYHFSKKKIDGDDVISNRCYLGYSKNKKLHSYVHGNTYARSTQIYAYKKNLSDIVKTSMLQNQYYTIQKEFSEFDKNELAFTNPTSKILKFNVGGKDYKMNPGCSKIIEIKSSIITIKSNCMFLRPIVFSYKDNYLDVHHG